MEDETRQLICVVDDERTNESAWRSVPQTMLVSTVSAPVVKARISRVR